MEIIFRNFDRHLEALKKIEASGALDILHDQAKQLKEKGDPTAIVLRHRTFGDHLLIALHWRLTRSGSARYPAWTSLGAGMEATDYSTPAIRFTDGSSWNYLDYGKQAPQSDSLESQIQRARQLARPQSDYRFGERLSSWNEHARLIRGYKVLVPKI